MRSGSWLPVLLLACASSPAFSEPPTGPAFVEQWRDARAIQFAGHARIAVADVDADTFPDFVFVGSSGYYLGSYALVVAGASPDGIGIKQAIILPDDANVIMRRVLTATIDEVTHVFTISDDGTVRDFSGWPLAEAQHYSVTGSVTGAAIGDVLGTGEACLVIGSTDGIRAYDAKTGMPLWTYLTQGAADIALAQLDADSPLEVIASGGLVIDGATQATDWQYVEDFGSPLTTGHVLGDQTTQFAAVHGTYFGVYRGTPWSPLWSAGDAYVSIQALIAADLDGNNRDVIISGDSQPSGSINAYDAITHQTRFSIPNAGAGIEALASADIDGDGVAELAISPNQASTFGSTRSTFQVIDTSSGETKWSYEPFHGTLSRVELADVDGDGADELIVAGNVDYYGGTVAIFDATGGALEWQSPPFTGYANEPFFMSTSRILLLPHQHDAGKDIVLAGASTYSGRIVVLDGVTHAVKLQIDPSAAPLSSRYIIDAVALDYDGDGTTDFVLATQPSFSNSPGALLQVLSGSDGHSLWTSVPMLSSGYSFINGVLATGPSTDPSSKLIAVLPTSLRAYNIQTQLLDWTLLVSADGALYIPTGVSGPEIAVFLSTGAVTFYNATTRAYLRSFTLDAPLSSLLSPDGNASTLIAAANGHLLWVDGHDGTIIASSDFLGQNLALGNRLAARARAPGIWDVAAGTDLAVFRHRMESSDQVFANGFDALEP